MAICEHQQQSMAVVFVAPAALVSAPSALFLGWKWNFWNQQLLSVVCEYTYISASSSAITTTPRALLLVIGTFYGQS